MPEGSPIHFPRRPSNPFTLIQYILYSVRASAAGRAMGTSKGSGKDFSTRFEVLLHFLEQWRLQGYWLFRGVNRWSGVWCLKTRGAATSSVSVVSRHTYWSGERHLIYESRDSARENKDKHILRETASNKTLTANNVFTWQHGAVGDGKKTTYIQKEIYKGKLWSKVGLTGTMQIQVPNYDSMPAYSTHLFMCTFQLSVTYINMAVFPLTETTFYAQILKL